MRREETGNAREDERRGEREGERGREERIEGRRERMRREERGKERDDWVRVRDDWARGEREATHRPPGPLGRTLPSASQCVREGHRRRSSPLQCTCVIQRSGDGRVDEWCWWVLVDGGWWMANGRGVDGW
jgi:hypothetical protein